MKKLFYCIGFLLFFSCADDELADLYEVTPIPDGGVSIKVVYHDKHNFLGVGYDATEAYLSDMAVKLPVIDLEKVPESRKYISNADLRYSSHCAGATPEEFLKDISKLYDVSLVIDGNDVSWNLFSGTILNSEQFKSTYSHAEQYSFASCDKIYNKKELRLNASVELLQTCLTSKFVDDVEKCSADQLVETYGTHVLTDVGIGGRIHTLYRSLVIASSKTPIVRAGLNSSMNKNGLFPGGMSSAETDENISKNIGGKLEVEYHGGAPMVLPIFPNIVDVNKWQQTVNDDNAVLVKINWEETIPIYELISDPVKKEQVKDAIVRLIERRRLIPAPVTPIIQVWNGRNHQYFTFYKTYCSDTGFPICSIYGEQVFGTIPLYKYSNDKRNLFSLDYHPAGIDGDWSYQGILGYVYSNPTVGAVPLYKAWNGDDFCYTTESAPAYGIYESWKNQGVVCYVLPLLFE